ncbi:unnamed protein product [Rhizoctonia solani]|uniref:BTB domain-containing protein n=1 Tax=Rhizoctonia solani TaxID=456999 RepID=A0A8H3CKT2_9AGAM|nr:unnamed protein product [Rhizoctonia solani]
MNSESSTQSSPVSVKAMSSAFSDIESLVSLNDHKSSETSIVPESLKCTPVHPEFSFPDGNVEIQTTGYVFWVHEYYLNKFSVFATLIQAAKGSETVGESGRRTAIVCERKTNAEDIYNTLQVIYASHVDGIPDFDSSVMISTLRIATVFNYPALRKFAISKLEKMDLPAIKRIQLSDELSLPSWEAPAFTELCSRKEPISTTEAEVLGMTRFVEIARIRETERARWAVKLVNDVNGDLVQPLKSVDLLQTDNPEYSSGRSALPKCDCGLTKDSAGTRRIALCELHTVAPRVLREGQALLKQRKELLRCFKDLGHAVESRLRREGSPGVLDVPTLEAEIKSASWIRREQSIAL